MLTIHVSRNAIVYPIEGKWYAACGEFTYGPYDTENQARSIAADLYEDGPAVHEDWWEAAQNVGKMLLGSAIILGVFLAMVWLVTLVLGPLP